MILMCPWGYRVSASIAREELERLGLDLEGGFFMGAFQADFRHDGSVVWYSLIPTDDKEADFHKPGVLHYIMKYTIITYLWQEVENRKYETRSFILL